MDKPDWEQAFTHQLQALLSLTPADIHFPWANFRTQGYSPSDAIAFLNQDGHISDNPSSWTPLWKKMLNRANKII
jgi:hypothetical protein